MKCDGVGDILVDEPFYNWKDGKRYIYNGDTIKDENGKPPVFEIDGITVNEMYINQADGGALCIFDGTSIKKLDYRIITLITPRYNLDKMSSQEEWNNTTAVYSEIAEVNGSRSGVHTVASTGNFKFYTLNLSDMKCESIEDIPVDKPFFNRKDGKLYVYDGTEIKVKEE